MRALSSLGSGDLAKFEYVDRRKVQRAVFLMGQFEEVIVVAELRGDLVCNEATIAVHRFRDALQEPVFRSWVDKKERKARNDIVTTGMAHLLKSLRQMEGICIQHCHPWVTDELFTQVGHKFLVELKQNEPRLGIHTLNDLPGVTSFARAELHNDSWP